MSDFQVPDDGFDLTENVNALPQALATARCSSFYVEFMKAYSDGDIEANKNHVVLKIDFDNPVGLFYGVRVSMDTRPEADVAPTELKPGSLLVDPRTYPAESRNSLKTLQLPILVPHISLQQILNLLTRRNMHMFYFVPTGDRYFGCRDFILQCVYVLEQAGIVSPALRLEDKQHIESVARSPRFRIDASKIYSVLGLRFYVDNVVFWPIDRGHFMFYQRVERVFMPYEEPLDLT